MAGRSHTLQIKLSEYQSQEFVATPCPLRSLARDMAAERRQKVCGCLEATEHRWGMLPPWIHQPRLACLSFLDTSWSNPRTIRKGIKFVSSDEKYHRLGQLNVCANGLQLQNCDMSVLNTHTHKLLQCTCPKHGHVHPHVESAVSKFLLKSTFKKC